MRLATRHNGHPHPGRMQVMRTSNGKFVVNPTGEQYRRASDAARVRPDEVGGPVSPSVFSPCEPNTRSEEQQQQQQQQGPALLGDRFLLLGPIEGSSLYRCVDVQTNQQLVAKVS